MSNGAKNTPETQRIGKLNKSIRIAGLHPSVTVEQMNDYVLENTPLNDKSKFRCKMLVKSGQDLSNLTFISFKIDVAADDFAAIVNPDCWPSHVTIREFVHIQKPKTGDTSTLRSPLQPQKIQRVEGESSKAVETMEVAPTDEAQEHITQAASSLLSPLSNLAELIELAK